MSRIDAATKRARREEGWEPLVPAPDVPLTLPVAANPESGDFAWPEAAADETQTPGLSTTEDAETCDTEPSVMPQETCDTEPSLVPQLQALDRRLTERFHPSRRTENGRGGQILAPAVSAAATKPVGHGSRGWIARIFHGRIARGWGRFAK